MGSCPRDLHISFNCVPGFSPVLDPRGRLGGKVGSACEEFEDIEGSIVGLMFLRVLVPAHRGCCGYKAIKSLCALLYLCKSRCMDVVIQMWTSSHRCVIRLY